MKMFVLAFLAAAIFLAPGKMPGQQTAAIDMVKVSPGQARVLLENEQVRVVEYGLKPGESDQPHTHPAKVSYTLSGGTLRIHREGSEPVNIEEAAGNTVWSDAVAKHFVQNTGVSPVRIVLFEVHGVPGEPAAREEDPAIVNPTSITVKLENDSVRVMEAVIPPGFREVQHTHPSYVMYILDGGKVRLHMADGRSRDSEFKAGDVFYSDRITHWAENTGTSTIRVLIVEIRRKRGVAR